MDRSEVLRAIHYDQLEYVQRKVNVDFNSHRRQPAGFFFARQYYPVTEVLCQFRKHPDLPANGFLVTVAGRGVFCLYCQQEVVQRRITVEPSFWVLSFRVLQDKELMKWYVEDRKMLANISLKRVVDFHGHLCPEVAIGGKVCEFVQNLLGTNIIPPKGFSIFCENTTSALDAIQVLLGVTVGNQRLLVMDYGKHNYTLFSREENRGWKLRMKPIRFVFETQFHALQEKILENRAELEDITQFQQILDARVKQILAFPVEELFSIEKTTAETAPPESACIYLTCSACGQQVLQNHTIIYGREILCLPCYQHKSPHHSSHCQQ